MRKNVDTFPDKGSTHDIPAVDAEGLSPDEFKAAFRSHPAGVALITADAGDGPVALTATSVFSVSAVPPLLVFSVSEFSSSTPTVRAAETVVVHLLGADQLNLATLGATSGINRFADTSLWSTLETGETYFPSASTWIRGQVVSKIAAGSSTVVVVHALETNAAAHTDEPTAIASAPLIYYNRTWHHLSEASTIK